MPWLPNPRAHAESIMPCPSPAVQRRMLAIVHAMGGLIQQAGSANPKLHGCLILPLGGMMLAGTACARPLLFSECDVLAREATCDLVVLRHDALRGTTFDIKLTSGSRWFRRYLATPIEGSVRMKAAIGIGPVFRASALGLEMMSDGEVSEPSPLMGQRAASSCLVEA